MIGIVVPRYGRNLDTAAAVALHYMLQRDRRDAQIFTLASRGLCIGHMTDTRLAGLTPAAAMQAGFTVILACGAVPDDFVHTLHGRVPVVLVVTRPQQLQLSTAVHSAASVIGFDGLATSAINQEVGETFAKLFLPLTGFPITQPQPIPKHCRVLFPLCWQLSADLEMTAIDIILRCSQRPYTTVRVMADSRDLSSRARYLLRRHQIPVCSRWRYDMWPILFSYCDLVACMAVTDTIGLMHTAALSHGCAVVTTDTPLTYTHDWFQDGVFHGGGHWRHDSKWSVSVTPQYAAFEEQLHTVLDDRQQLATAKQKAAAIMHDYVTVSRLNLRELVATMETLGDG